MIRLIFRTLILITTLIIVPPICSANVVHQAENSIPMDKWAHIGAGYIINDQLNRYTKLTPLERFLAVSCIAYTKEKFADSKFDHGDINATMVGALLYGVEF